MLDSGQAHASSAPWPSTSAHAAASQKAQDQTMVTHMLQKTKDLSGIQSSSPQDNACKSMAEVWKKSCMSWPQHLHGLYVFCSITQGG